MITAKDFYHFCHLIYHLVPFTLPPVVTHLTKTITKPYRPEIISLQGFLFIFLNVRWVLSSYLCPKPWRSRIDISPSIIIWYESWMIRSKIASAFVSFPN